jgi:hypothetical protein
VGFGWMNLSCSPLIAGLRQFLFPAVTITPPIIVAFFTEDVGVLVSVTGSYGLSLTCCCFIVG